MSNYGGGKSPAASPISGGWELKVVVMAQCWSTLRRSPTVLKLLKPLKTEVLFVTFIHFIQSFQLVDFEAMTTPSPDGFSKMAKSWMNLKRCQDRAQLFLLFTFGQRLNPCFVFFNSPACPAGTRAFRLSQRRSHPPEPWSKFSTQTRLHTVPGSPNNRGRCNLTQRLKFETLNQCFLPPAAGKKGFLVQNAKRIRLFLQHLVYRKSSVSIRFKCQSCCHF